MNERKRERRRNERKQDPIVEFIDGHGKFIRMSSRHLNEVGSMFTLFHPTIKHIWYYNGSPPTIEDHMITLKYLQGRFKRGISRNPNI
jgi:hypothetical protein